MKNREAQIRRWLAQIYNCRGQLAEEAWAKFAKFYAELGYWDDVTPGRRTDGEDPWDHLEQQLIKELVGLEDYDTPTERL